MVKIAQKILVSHDLRGFIQNGKANKQINPAMRNIQNR